MIFGEVPVEQAQGAILAHGVPAATLSKGIVLGSGHIIALQAIGVAAVTVARLEDGDVDEDTAATAVAEAIVPDAEAQGVRVTKAKSGRINVMSMRAGLLELDADRITALNGVDPMITVATLPNLERVTAGVMLATIKVIPYAVRQNVLANICAEIAGAQPCPDGALPSVEGPSPHAISIRTARLTTATLIETHHPGQRAQPRGRRVLEERLDRLGATLTQVLDVPHDRHAIANAIAHADGQAIFILTASATGDLYDTAPEALRLAGGRVTRFGIPVDPGNLLFLGEFTDEPLGTRPVVGLPGCARCPALNAVDRVLERAVCGLPIGMGEINAMGVGGLLKEVLDRGLPR